MGLSSVTWPDSVTWPAEQLAASAAWRCDAFGSRSVPNVVEASAVARLLHGRVVLERENSLSSRAVNVRVCSDVGNASGGEGVHSPVDNDASTSEDADGAIEHREQQTHRRSSVPSSVGLLRDTYGAGAFIAMETQSSPA
jgi:hypothetical protein